MVKTVHATPWGAEVEPCDAPCDPIRVRAQASTEATRGDRVLVAELATDGDPATAWCGVGGVGQRVSLALPGLHDVHRLHLGLADADGNGAWTKAKLTSDRRDIVTVVLHAPAGEGSAVVDVDLPSVEFLQLEALEVEGGPACIREVVVEGASVERVEPGQAEGPGDGVEHDPPGDEGAAGGPVQP